MAMYGVEYRNMHTAHHGFMIYDDYDKAYEVFESLVQLEGDEIDEDMYADILDDIYSDGDMIDLWEDINYRDVDWSDDDDAYIYEGVDGRIIVVNPEHEVPDIYE